MLVVGVWRCRGGDRFFFISFWSHPNFWVYLLFLKILKKKQFVVLSVFFTLKMYQFVYQFGKTANFYQFEFYQLLGHIHKGMSFISSVVNKLQIYDP